MAPQSNIGGVFAADACRQHPANSEQRRPAMSLEHETTIRVRYYETDAQGYVHHANYFKYFELARVEQLEAMGHDYADLERQGIFLVVHRITCRYHRPCRFGDQIRVKIRTVQARAARIDHEYRVHRGNELLAEGESTLACIDREGHVQRLPDYLRNEH
jgi:acyl-CoA thioester hydrolase